MRSGLPPVPGSSGSESSNHHSPSKPISFNLVTLQPELLHRDDVSKGRSRISGIYKNSRDSSNSRHRHVTSTGKNSSFQRITAITQLEQVEEKDNPS